MAAPAQGISAKQATQIIDLLTDMRDALRLLGRTPAQQAAAGGVHQLHVAMGQALPNGQFAAIDECSCGSRLVQRQLGHDGSKTWRCRACGAHGHLHPDAVV